MSMTGRRFSPPLVQAVVAVALAIGGTLAFSTLSPDSQAHAQPSRDVQAEQFVQTQAQRVIAVLNDQADNERAFRAIVDQVADVPRITSFVLGKYARTITPDQMRRFAPVFRAYEQSVYRAQLSHFHGKSVRVTGSVIRRPGDVIVNTMIAGDGYKQPLPVAWRVMGGGGAWKVVDVQAKGVWLAITEQQDFVSTIDNNGGDVDALIAQLQQKAYERPSRASGR
jgi:phospholipid transport system substrate-binding protein